MKKCVHYLSAALCALFLLSFPIQARAAWTPQPLPAAAVDTVFGDSRYIDPAWLTKKVTISYQGTTWVTGMDAFRDMPVRLTNANGAIDCTFLNTDVFSSYFSAINAQLAALTQAPAAPVFDNGAGSYIKKEAAGADDPQHDPDRGMQRHHTGAHARAVNAGDRKRQRRDKLGFRSGRKLHDQL